MSVILKVLREGENKPNPLTICIIANPALEAPWQTGQFMPDPIAGNEIAFNSSCEYIVNSIFGRLPDQRESFMADPNIESRIRVVSLFAPGLSAEDKNSLVAQDSASNLLVARRTKFKSFLAAHGIVPDVAYAVSASITHTRATAWYTSDDDSKGGIDFDLDGQVLCHRFFNLIPGTVAIHSSANSLTALHEFGHAFSSYTNGKIVDLYVDGEVGVNNKHGRPIPDVFAIYGGTAISSDKERNGVKYPPGWISFHGKLRTPEFPAAMDDYWLAHDGVPNHCQHDVITRSFLTDRLLAKLSR